VVIYDYKKTGWKQEIGDAALVIGHAGAGTILDSLEALKPIIVVANDLLMSQHQSEIASLMARLGYCYHTTPGNLIKHLPGFLDKLDFLRVFPGKETSAFANEVSHFLSGGEKPNFLTKMPSKRRSLRLNNDK
jgi:UDP-N-acetylglucosamine transferase subunit ALG13